MSLSRRARAPTSQEQPSPSPREDSPPPRVYLTAIDLVQPPTGTDQPQPIGVSGAEKIVLDRLADLKATNAQVVFCSHEHVDHTDPRTLKPLSQASPRAIIVGSSWSRDMLLEAGVAEGRIRVPKLDAPSQVSGLAFTAVPSAHYGLDSDPERGHRWFGYVIELNGVTLYHSGDTILHDGLVDRLKGASVDIACLPVNGRDFWREHRGIIGNLDAREAAELAATIGADVLIPMHNDMFAANHASPGKLYA